MLSLFLTQHAIRLSLQNYRVNGGKPLLDARKHLRCLFRRQVFKLSGLTGHLAQPDDLAIRSK
ncbi:hypothetical protein DBV39_15805 [Orrella marina]|uniref:Uncharacterized protein n=1 Tax=Orrella marina TaxID=2163011 RepID=A0A2R4XMD3_9BURK|nr:hypothetical protein DBV39_15805 [Orrella marina]